MIANLALVSILCCVFLHEGFSQSQDTVIVLLGKHKSIKSKSLNSNQYLYFKNDTFYFKKTFDYKSFDDYVYIMDKLKNSPYCAFYDKKMRKVEECNWDYENISGHYNSYFENGQLKATGEYLGSTKIGRWRYFDKKGKLVNEIVYELPPIPDNFKDEGVKPLLEEK